MTIKKSIRIYGSLLALPLMAFLIWQISPSMNAQRSIKQLGDSAAEEKTPFEPVVTDSPDDKDSIYLNAGALNVKSDSGNAARNPVGDFSGKRMHLVKFDGAIQPQWHKSLTDSGLEIIDYIPNYAYLVYGDSTSLQRLQSRAGNAKNHIQWEGAYLDEYRIAPDVYRAAPDADRAEGEKSVAARTLRTEEFSIQLYKDQATNDATLATLRTIETKPIKGQQEISHYVNLVVGLDEEGIRTMAARPDVISIQPYFQPTKFDERQDIIMTGNLNGNAPVQQNYLTYLAGKGFAQSQFDASNFSVNVSDSGIDNATTTPNHFALYRLGVPTSTSRIVYNRLEGTANSGSTLRGLDGHGNLNAHIIGGYVPDSLIGVSPHSDTSGFRYGLGIAPFVKMGSSVIFDPGTFTNPNYPNLESRAYRDGARISSNSWGANTSAYTTDSQSYDFLVRDAQPSSAAVPTAGNQEYTIFFSAGNSGSNVGTIGSPGTAKNVITVGATENAHPFGGADACAVSDTGADSANDIIDFSSRGPTSDQRRKPEIVAPGTHVTGGVAQNSLVNPAYSGTGLAITGFDASGVCAGVNSNFFPSSGQQWYTASSGTSHSTPAVAGFAALIRQDFINRSLTPPSPAMTKALIVNSARYLTGVAANDTLPSNSQGMGGVSMNNYFDSFTTGNIIKDQVAADVFTASGQQRQITGTILDSTKPFKVTLAWTDAPGSTTGNAFVNNLDLEVSVNGTTYLGNVFTNSTSTGGGAADTRNNVESIILPAGLSGSFAIRVKSTNIAGDGIPNNAAPLDQDFALVVTNATQALLPVLERGVGTALTAESITPNNSAPDPNETVTFNLPITNIGTAATTNLVATLQSSGGVLSPSSAQNYGAVATGATVLRPFTFVANGACGSNITLTLALQDGATSYGTITYTVRLGTQSVNPVQTFSNTAAIVLPATGASGGVGAPGSVYPSSIAVSGLSGTISKLTVRLNNMSHTYSNDIDVLLVSPSGAKFILMSDAMGSADLTGQSYTFDDDAAAVLPSASTIPATGSYKPTNYDTTTDNFPSPAPAAPYLSPGTAGTATLASAFNGTNPNGTWSLYVIDDTNVDSGTIAGGWTLNVTTSSSVCNSQSCALTPPSNVTVQATNQSGAIVNYPSAIVAGACGVVSYSPPSGSLFPVGTTTVNINSANRSAPDNLAPNAVSSFTVTVLGPTAAPATVAGIVRNFDGRGIANAAVSLTDMNGNVRTGRTNAFGYFQILGVNTGASYVGNISAKARRFEPFVLNVNESLTDLEFYPIP